MTKLKNIGNNGKQRYETLHKIRLSLMHVACTKTVPKKYYSYDKTEKYRK